MHKLVFVKVIFREFVDKRFSPEVTAVYVVFLSG